MGHNVTVSGINDDNLEKAAAAWADYGDQVQFVRADAANYQDAERLWHTAQQHWGTIDIWINNAGVVQPEVAIWDIDAAKVRRVMDTNLVGVVYGSQVAAAGMIGQGHGTVFNMEGFGSSSEMRWGLSLYGTTKKGLTYFTQALAKELKGTGVKACLLNPGMVVTDLVKYPEGPKTAAAPRDEVVRIFNILGDKPETVAEFLAQRIDGNPRTGTRIRWLTRGKILGRFLMSPFVKRDLFS